MPKKIEIEVFEFNELDEKAKGRARKLLLEDIERNRFENWWDSLYEDAAQAGIAINSFDLYGQGQHVSIDFDESPEETASYIMANHGEECGSHSAAMAFMEKVKNVGDDSDEYLDHVSDFREALEKYYLGLLQQEYDWSESDEYLADYAEAMEITFLKDGLTLIPSQE